MSDQYRPPERAVPVAKSNNTAFIVGGLVVAVALLLWFVLGNRPPVGADNGGTTNSVTVHTPAPAPADPVAPAPADPVTPAPADPVTPAPADPVAPAPTAPAPAPAAPANP